MEYRDVEGTLLSVGDRVWTHYVGRVRIRRLCVLMGRKVFYYGPRTGQYDYVEFCHKPQGKLISYEKIVAPFLGDIRKVLDQDGPHGIDAMRIKLKLPTESRKKTQIALEVLFNSGEITKVGNEYCYRDWAEIDAPKNQGA